MLPYQLLRTRYRLLRQLYNIVFWIDWGWWHLPGDRPLKHNNLSWGNGRGLNCGSRRNRSLFALFGTLSFNEAVPDACKTLGLLHAHLP